jgi:hypothetical protein
VPTIGRTVVRPYIAPSMDCRRSVVAAGDYVRAKTPLRSVFALTSIAPTHAAIASAFNLARKKASLCKYTVFSLNQPTVSPE